MISNLSRQASISSSSHSSTKSHKSFWSKIGHLFHSSRSSRCSNSSKSSTKRRRRHSDFSRQTTGNYSNSTLSDESVKTVEGMDDHSSLTSRRHIKQLVNQTETAAAPMLIPPFSPTYCKSNEFPYSNFYVKLPDGRWMVRYRDGNRDILRTDIMEGYMI
ncbi:hypothetical protein V8B55DRAFT_1465848 [Mucor lusitanicus]|uniref:Uncharacterized protein n=2 Tax=Mucor circinelloides f. lusitanicus TaxID=29924 RepID=A0A162QE43_MUCCL|nr:hypothetical protein FB192DRAFT_1355857 [Mucor lusitanicus]OAD01260.1 hypothetical protein MUCCIDRAFT_165155 [Mucor lusitanicus CBS 277.49]